MQAISLVKQQAAIIKIPAAIKEIPPNRWLFFQVVSFFMLQPVRRPIREFIRSLGIIFPTTTIDSPKRPQTSWLISIRTKGTPPRQRRYTEKSLSSHQRGAWKRFPSPGTPFRCCARSPPAWRRTSPYPA